MQHTDLLPVPYGIELAEPEPDDAPDLSERRELKVRAFKRAPGMSLLEAARRGLRWAVRRLAEASHPVASIAGTVLTEADKRFLTWLANAAIAFYVSENRGTAEG